MYENICKKCNPGAGRKGEVDIKNKEIPSLYVGESSRTIRERSMERRGAYKSNVLLC